MPFGRDMWTPSVFALFSLWWLWIIEGFRVPVNSPDTIMVSSRPFVGIIAKAPFWIWDKETMHQKYDLLLLYQCSWPCHSFWWETTLLEAPVISVKAAHNAKTCANHTMEEVNWKQVWTSTRALFFSLIFIFLVGQRFSGGIRLITMRWFIRGKIYLTLFVKFQIYSSSPKSKHAWWF